MYCIGQQNQQYIYDSWHSTWTLLYNWMKIASHFQQRLNRPQVVVTVNVTVSKIMLKTTAEDDITRLMQQSRNWEHLRSIGRGAQVLERNISPREHHNCRAQDAGVAVCVW